MKRQTKTVDSDRVRNNKPKINQVKTKFSVIADSLLRVAEGKWFMRFILLLVVIQGFWFAVSFLPTIYDEGQHIDFIEMYSERLSPFISNQDSKWDLLGDTTRNASYLYYYLMSFVQRVGAAIFESAYLQLLLLRIVNITFFTAGIYGFIRFFDKIRIPKLISRIAILITVLTPSIAMLPGSVNYDNLMLLCGALLLHSFLRIYDSKKFETVATLQFIAIAMFGVLVKWQFLVFLVPLAILLAWHYYRHGIFSKIKLAEFAPRSWGFLALEVLVIVLLGLFIERPIYNLVKYHDVTVACKRIISEERCNTNYTQKRNNTVLENKPEGFTPKAPVLYAADEWFSGMTITQTRVIPSNRGTPLMIFFFQTITLLAVAVWLLFARDLIKERKYVAAITFVVVLYAIALFTYNYLDYKKFALPVAVTSRYFLLIMPLFWVMIGLSVERMLRGRRILATGIVILLMLVFLQGGGIMTYSLNHNPTHLQKNDIIRKTNAVMWEGFHILVIGR